MSRIPIRFAVALVALVALVAAFAVPGALAKSHRKHHHATAHHRSNAPSSTNAPHKPGDSHSGSGSGDHGSNAGTGSGDHGSGSGDQGDDQGDGHPTPPPLPPTANAGTVASFTGGVLVVNLTAGGTISGAVPDGTPVICRPAIKTRSDTPAGGGDQPPSTTPTTTTTPPPPPPPTVTPCGTAALVAGAVIHEAGMVLGPNGPRFTAIVIITG